MSDTASVTISTTPLVPITGRGAVRFMASVEVTISDIPVMMRGGLLKESQPGKMTVHLPATRHPKTGDLGPAIDLPADLLRSIGETLLSQAPGGVMMVRKPLPGEDLEGN
jgi:hypothetical protein